MNLFQNQLMEYDRLNTMFSPEGRLIQVEYARKATKHGSIILGLVCEDGVLMIADKIIIDKLIVVDKIEKMFKIDNHIVGAVSGLMSDGRIMIERSQVKAQQHRVTYDSAIDVKEITTYISNISQRYTQFAGVRPFGASLMIMGVDSKARLYITEPSGVYMGYYATAIGENNDEVRKILLKKYNKSINLNSGLKLALFSLKEVLKDKFNIDKIECYYIKEDNKKVARFTKNELKNCS